MTDQPILDELHSIRERLLAESGGTLAGLVARLRKDQQESGRIIRKNPTNQVLHGSSGGESTLHNESTSGTP